MKTLISFDPGRSSGIAIGTYSDTEPYRPAHIYQIEGGLSGFLNYVENEQDTDDFSNSWGEWFFTVGFGVMLNRYFLSWGGLEAEESEVTFISEKFTPRQALSLASAEPLRIEGSLVTQGIMPDYPDLRWRQPAKQYFAGGSDLAERKKNAYAWLKRHEKDGLYVTGKDVGCKDANDARSAILHSIAYLRDIKHRPTIDYYFGRKENDEN